MRRLCFFSLAILTGFTLGCADSNYQAESLLPKTDTTCGGQAIQNRYIVRFKSGAWGSYSYTDRELFKSEIVVPLIDSIDFIEYDQKISIQNYSKSESISPTFSEYNWGAKNIGAENFWQNNIYGDGVVVAVIDSGVDVSHPLLKDQISYNTAESGLDSLGHDKSINGVDDDNNGFIDDYAGFDFTSTNKNMTDEVSHGTHVAGIIAAGHRAKSISSDTVQGVAPGAKILPIKFLTPNGGLISDALNSIDYAVLRGAKIINASWGGTGCSLSLKHKISDLSRHNVLFVAAAGNSGSNLELYPEFPAAFNLPFQITVGSITENLLPAEHSNYSSLLVSLFAPGKNILSTVPNDSYATYEGTSMAAPFVSGAAALLLSNAPHLSASELKDLVLSSVKKDPFYMNQTQGRLFLASGQASLAP